jgi:hypothetical protein
MWYQSWSYGSEVKYCELNIKIPQKYGYSTLNSVLSYTGIQNSYQPDVYVNGIRIQENPANGKIAISNYATTSDVIVKFGFPQNTNNNIVNNFISGFSLTTNYELTTKTFPREALGDLVFTSSIDDLETAFYKDLRITKPTKPAPTQEELEALANAALNPEPKPVATLDKEIVKTNATPTQPLVTVKLYTGTTTEILVKATATKEVVSSKWTDVVSTSTRIVVDKYIENVIEELERELVSTSTVDVLSTSTKEVITEYIENVISKGQKEVVSTSTVFVISTSTKEVVNSYIENIVNTLSRQVVSTSSVNIISTSTRDIVTSYTDYITEYFNRDVATTSLVNIVSTSTREVVTPYTVKVTATSTRDVATSTLVNIVSTSTREVVTPYTDYITEYFTRDVATTSLATVFKPTI